MKILSWYIAKAYFNFWLLCLTTLLTMIIVSKLFGDIEDIFTGWPNFLNFVENTAADLPTAIELMLPMTILLATVFTFNSLGRTSELVAMQSAGMGLARQLLPIHIVLIAISAFGYINQNYLFRLLQLEEGKVTVNSRRNQWYADPAQIYFVQRNQTRSERALGVKIFRWAEAHFALESIEQVAEVRRKPETAWVFHNVAMRQRNGSLWNWQKSTGRETPLGEFPDVFQPAELEAHHAPIVELSREILRNRAKSRRVELYMLEWYQKTAAMFAPIFLVWFGTPLSQVHFRRGWGSGEVMVALLGGLLYTVGSETLFLLGKGGFLHPLLATWTVNLLFGALGLLMMRRRN